MSFDNSYTAVTGATYQAADYNTSTKGNFTAIWVGTTAGDMDYYTSATAKNRLALVTGGLLVGGASAPQWLANSNGSLLMGGASSPTWLGFNYANQFLRTDGSSPLFSGMVLKRQGGNDFNWQTTGTTTYTPITTIWQAGSASVTVGTPLSITYPTSFTYRPLIFLSVSSSSGKFIAMHTSDSITGFTIVLKETDNNSGTKDVNWMAISQ